MGATKMTQIFFTICHFFWHSNVLTALDLFVFICKYFVFLLNTA